MPVDTARARAEAALRRDATLEAVAFAAMRLLEEPDWEGLAPKVLRRLGESVGVSRVYLYENRAAEAGLHTVLVAQWLAPGVGPAVIEGTALGFRGLERWVTVLERGDVLHGIVDELPASEREVLGSAGRSSDIRSLLLAPIVVGGLWWGYLGFDDCVRERVWTQVEIDALRAVAGTFGSAIHRERSDTRLRETESRYRQLVERVPAISYIDAEDPASPTWPTQYVSPQIESILGYSPDEWLADPTLWLSLLHPDDREAALAADDEHYATGAPLRSEYRLIAKDGTLVWVRDQATMVVASDGSRRSQGVLIDITESKRAEEQLRDAEAKYRQIVELTPAITYLEHATKSYSDEGSVVYMSPQVERILGYPTEDWSRIPGYWMRVVHPDDLERVQVEVDRTASSGENYSQEYRMVAADGRVVWFRDDAVLIRDEQGRPLLWHGVMVDITDRKLAEDKVKAAEARYRDLVENIPAVTYRESLDADPEVFYVSPQVTEIFGYRPEEWTWTPGFWAEHVHPEDRERVMALDRETNASGRPFSCEYRLRHADGTYVWIQDQASLVGSGGERFWQGFMLDITERKRAEERIERALEVEREAAQRLRSLDEMKNTFLQAVSHDLRTPLAAILGLAVTLERGEVDLAPEDSRDLAHRIANNARKLDRMVMDLLDLDRLARGIVEPKIYPTDVGALVRRIVTDSELISEDRVTLETPNVVAGVDAAKVERIVENLLANTARHTPPGTGVWVRVAPADAGVVLVVEDAGPGVPPEMREAIFEPFRQGPGASEHSPGVGVGLTLVRRFAELHGGRAWVEERAGGGASFRVYLADGRPAAATRGRRGRLVPGAAA